MNVKIKTHSLQAVPGDGNVFLSITIGNAQIGGSVITNSSSQLIAKGDIQNLLLGTSAQLQGQLFKVVTNVLDVNPHTNGAVTTLYLHNCVPSTFTYSDSVDNDGDILSFEITITFN